MVSYLQRQKYMYRVSYYNTGSNVVIHKEFDSLELAMKFSLEQPINSVFEIKLHNENTDNNDSYKNK